MSWNHRILAHATDPEVLKKIGRGPDDDEIRFEIHEVYYDKDGITLNGYTENTTVGGANKREIKWALTHMIKALEKPILWAGDKFPQEYKKVKKR